MGFVYPGVLWLFVLLVPLLVLWTFVTRAQDRRLTHFMIRENWTLLNPNVSKRARFHKGVLLLLALSFSIVAAARPYWGEREREVKRSGVNVIFAIDVSLSMLAQDVGTNLRAEAGKPNPTRLDYAKTLVRQVLVEARGHRIGIMPFAGEAFLQCPLTTDYGIAQDIARQVDFDSIGLEGTNIEAMIDTAVDSFKRAGEGTRALVILTDGEDHSKAISNAADRAADAGVRIFALGVGSQEGAPIILPNGSFKSASDGTKVLSKLDQGLLSDLAQRTGGRAYVAGDSGRVGPDAVIRDLQSLERGEFGDEIRVVREERYQIPLALALLCLMIEMAIHDRRRALKKSRRAPVHLTPVEGSAR